MQYASPCRIRIPQHDSLLQSFPRCRRKSCQHSVSAPRPREREQYKSKSLDLGHRYYMLMNKSVPLWFFCSGTGTHTCSQLKFCFFPFLYVWRNWYETTLLPPKNQKKKPKKKENEQRDNSIRQAHCLCRYGTCHEDLFFLLLYPPHPHPLFILLSPTNKTLHILPSSLLLPSSSCFSSQLSSLLQLISSQSHLISFGCC